MSTSEDDWESVPIENLNISQNFANNGNAKSSVGPPPQSMFSLNSGININFMQGIPSQTAIAAVVAAQNDPPLDLTLIDAINSKERMTALKYEDQLLRFVKSGQMSFEIPPILNTYQKLLVYRIAQRFRLEHVHSDKVTGGERGIRIIRTVETAIPHVLLINLGGEAPQEKQSPPINSGNSKIKFLKRDSSAGSGIAKSDTNTVKVVLSEAEQELRYNLTKARIFDSTLSSSSNSNNPKLEDPTATTTATTSPEAVSTTPTPTNNPPPPPPTTPTTTSRNGPAATDTKSKQPLSTATSSASSNKSNSDPHRSSSSSNSHSSSSSSNAPLRPNASFLPKGKKLAEREKGSLAFPINTEKGTVTSTVAAATTTTTTVTKNTTGTPLSTAASKTTTAQLVPPAATAAVVAAGIPVATTGKVTTAAATTTAPGAPGNAKEEDSSLLAQRLKEREKSKKVAVVDAGQWKGKRSTTRNKIAELSDPDFARNPSPTININYPPAPLLPPSQSPFPHPSQSTMYGMPMPPGPPPPPMNQFQQQQQQQQLPLQSNYNSMNANNNNNANNNPFFMTDPRNIPSNPMNMPYHQLPNNNNNSNNMIMNSWQQQQQQPLLPPPPPQQYVPASHQLQDRSNGFSNTNYCSDMSGRGTAPLLPPQYYHPNGNSGGYNMPVNGGGIAANNNRYDNYYQSPMAPPLPVSQQNNNNNYMNSSNSNNNTNPSIMLPYHPLPSNGGNQYVNHHPHQIPSAPLLPVAPVTSTPVPYNYNVDFPPLG